MTRYFYNKTFLTCLAFALICALSAWLAFYSLQNLGTNPNANRPDTPDSFMTNVQHTRYNEQGQWESSFSTPHMLHYPKDKTSILTDPQLTSRGEDQLLWIIQGKHGIAKDDGNTIYLKDQVLIQRKNTDTGKVSNLITSALTAYPKRKYIESNQAVKILEPGSIINAVGFNANLNTGNIQLLSKVSTTYVETQAH